MEENYVGPVLPGQRWVELRGIFTLGELKAVVSRIESNFTEAFKDKKITDSKETASHLKALEDAIEKALNGEDEQQ